MEDKSNQREGNVPRRQFVPVKSKYLDFTRKNSSESDNSGASNLKAAPKSSVPDLRARASIARANTTIGGKPSRAAASAKSLAVPRPERKTSTPTKDTSLFSADVSAVPTGTEHEMKKVKEENLAELSEKAFIEYNKALLLQALCLIVEEQTAEFAGAAEPQLNMLQEAVSDSACELSNLDLQIDVEATLDEIHEDVSVLSEVFKQVVDNAAITDKKSFEDLTSELEGILDQLPCKNVRVPSSQQDFDEVNIAGALLSDALTDVFNKHGDEVETMAGITEQLSKLDSTCNSLEESNASIKELLPIASSKVIDETAQSMMNSTLGYLKVKF